MSSDAPFIWECRGCGAQFRNGEVRAFAQCSRTQFGRTHGAGIYLECPKCGKIEAAKDLTPSPPPDPNYRGPVLRRITSFPLYDNETPNPGAKKNP